MIEFGSFELSSLRINHENLKRKGNDKKKHRISVYKKKNEKIER